MDSAAPKDADRKPVHAAIYDGGSGVLRVRVGKFDAVVKALEMKGNGCAGGRRAGKFGKPRGDPTRYEQR